MLESTGRQFFRGEIRDPLRCGWFGCVLLIFLIVGWTVAQIFSGSLHTWVFCAAVVILPLAILSESIHTVHFNLLLLCFFLMNVFPHFSTHPFSRLTLLLLYAYVVLLIPTLRRTVGWLRLGKLNAKMCLLILAMVILEVVGVRDWVRGNSPDLSRYTGMVPDLPLGLLLVYGVGFAAFNAALEEITCRGVMMEALDSAFGAGYWSILIQAVAFGAAHYGSGFPNGVEGSGMTFGYALVIGFIRRKTRGILGCWIVHFFGDVAVFCSIVFFIHHTGK